MFYPNNEFLLIFLKCPSPLQRNNLNAWIEAFMKKCWIIPHNRMNGSSSRNFILASSFLLLLLPVCVSFSPPHLLLCFSLKKQIQYPSAVFILAHIWGKFFPSTYSLCLYIYFLGVLKGLIGLKTYNWLDSDHRNHQLSDYFLPS